MARMGSLLRTVLGRIVPKSCLLDSPLIGGKTTTSVGGSVSMEEVVAAAEIADYLGVSRQRVAVLVERADFPAPVAHLSVGRVWRTTDVRQRATKRHNRVQEDEQE
jgi:prophage regulatory protein